MDDASAKREHAAQVEVLQRRLAEVEAEIIEHRRAASAFRKEVSTSEAALRKSEATARALLDDAFQ